MVADAFPYIICHNHVHVLGKAGMYTCTKEKFDDLLARKTENSFAFEVELRCDETGSTLKAIVESDLLRISQLRVYQTTQF